MIDDLRTAEYVTRTLGGVRGALRQFLAEPSTRLYEAIYLEVVTNLFAVSIFLLEVAIFLLAVGINLNEVKIFLF